MLDAAAIAGSTNLSAADLNPDLLRLDSPFSSRRRGAEVKIIAGDRCPTPDATLIRGLRLAHLWSERVKAGTPLRQIAAETGVTDRYVARLIPLSGLSPKIQAAIMDGTQPVDLTLEHLVRHPLLLDWIEQARRLGFGI